MRVDRIVKAAVAALEDIKARDVLVLNVVKLTSMFDRVIIATGDSTRQVKALADNVQVKLKEKGAKIHGVEGAQSAEWILIDLGSVIVHVMLPAVRAHYQLEELWAARPARKTRRSAAATAER
ncbi:MAG: ribosome silencing factor [Burkholderiales bacterium]|nr:ribosome silencing factor [Burkholderiales bacterium]